MKAAHLLNSVLLLAFESRRVVRRFVAFGAIALLSASGVHAATLWWDGDASTANSASDNTSTAAMNWLSGGNWDNGITSAALASWTTGDSAIFGGSSTNQTITAGTITVGNLTFGQGAQGAGATNWPGYTIASGTLTLSSGSIITNNTAATINSILAGGGLTKQGTNTLTLDSGNNTYASGTTVSAGSLRTSTNAAFGPGSVTVNSNANLWFNPTRFSTNAVNYTNNLILMSGATLYAGMISTTNGDPAYVAKGPVTNNGAVNISGTVTFASSATTRLVFSGPISGSGTFVVSVVPGAMGNGAWGSRGYSRIYLTNPTNSWTGGTTILKGNGAWSQGLGDANAVYAASLGSGPIQLGSGSDNYATPGFLYLTAANAINPGSTVLMYDNQSAQPASSQMDLNGYSQTIAGLTSLGANGTFGQHCKVISASGSPTLTISNTGDYTFRGVITSGINLVKAGAGTQTLTNAQTYTGTTTVNGGALAVNGSLSTNTVTVNSGGTLAGTGTFNGQVTAQNGGTVAGSGRFNRQVIVQNGGLLMPGTNTYTIGTLTMASNGPALTLNGGASLVMDITTTTNDVIALTNVSGTLTLNGTNTITLLTPFGTVPAGTYTLMTYAALAGSGSLILDAAYPNAALNVGATSVTLTVTGGGLNSTTTGGYVWYGDGVGNVWDIATTANWRLGGAPATYANWAGVTFDDTGSSNPAVSISTAVQPFAVNVASANNFTLQGASIASGGALTKSGAGRLTLANDNSYVAGVTINEGVVQVGNGSTSGSLTGAIANNAALNISRSDAFTFATPVTGTGSITNLGSGTVTLTLTNSHSGGTVASAGSLRTSVNRAFGSGTVTVNTNANVWFNPTQTSSSAVTYTNSLVLNSGASVYAGPASYTTLGEAGYTAQGPVTNTGSVSISGTVTLASSAKTPLVFAGPISGSGGITVTYTPGAMGDGGSPNVIPGFSLIHLTNPTNNWTGGTTILWGNGGYSGGVNDANRVYAASLGSGPIQLGASAMAGYRGVAFLYLTAANAIKSDSTVSMYDNTYEPPGAYYSQMDLNGYSQTIAGLSSAGANGALGAYCKVLSASGSPTLTISNSGDYTFRGVISSGLNLVKAGVGTQTLTNVQTYSGTTTINGGRLALIGGALITNTASIVVASNAVFDVSGKSSAFTLAQSLSTQTLSNSAPGAIINGTNNCSAGTVSLVYDGVNPSFTITNGGMTLSASTTFKVNKTGAALAHGSYKIISKATVGNVGLAAGTLPAVTVSGGGITNTPGETSALQLNNEELYLVVNAAPVAKAITNGAPAGVTSVIRLIGGKAHLAPTDADGDALLVFSVQNPSALLSATVTTDGTNILYTPGLNASGADTVQYVVSDGYGGYSTNTMYVTVTSQSFNLVSGPTLVNNQFQVTFAGVPNTTYAVDDSTNSVTGPWAFFTNLTAGTNGLFQLVATNDPPAAMRFFRTRPAP